MTCFEIILAVPVFERQTMNVLNDKKIAQLRKSYNADICKQKTAENQTVFQILVCNEDAVGFLQDLPSPVVCLRVSLVHEKTLLYSNYKKTHTKTIPPRELLLKQVYWSASQLERHQLRESRM